MKNTETHDYWRWKLVRQVSTFVNNPSEQKTEDLLKLISDYSKVNQNLLLLQGYTDGFSVARND